MSGRADPADGRAGRAGRPARRLRPRPDQPRRGSHARRAARQASRASALPDALLIVARRVQPRQSSALRAAADRARPADGGRAQHDRPRQARRARARRREASAKRTRRAGDRDRGGAQAAASTSCMARLERTAAAARARSAPATARPHDLLDPAAPGARHRDGARSSAKRRCGGSPTGSTACCCIRSPARSILAAMLFVMFQAVFAWCDDPGRRARRRRSPASADRLGNALPARLARAR